MRAPLRAVSTALSLSVLSLGVVACSGDTTDGEDTATSSSEAEESPEPGEAPSADVATAPGAEPEVAPFLDRLRAGFGEEGSVHVQMTMSGDGELSAEGDTTYGPGGSDMRLTMAMPGSGGQVTMVLVDDLVFLSMPGLTPEGKFFEVPEDSPALAGFDASGLSPADSFASFEAGLLKVEEQGEEEIDGEPTERFELHLDAERATAALGTGGSTAGLPETLVYDVWLDTEDRMRRIDYAVSGTEVTMDMTRWGEVGPVTAPDPADIVEAPDLGRPE